MYKRQEADELISDLREDDEISPLSLVNTLSDVYRTQNMKSLIDFEVKVDSIFRTSPKLTAIGKRIREDLLKRRNLNWMNKIPELMKAQPTFIAVGVRDVYKRQDIKSSFRHSSLRNLCTSEAQK